MSAEKEKGKVATAWLSNPIVVWGGGALLAYLGIRLLLPGAYKYLADGFSNGVDNVLGLISDIVGKPQSQDLNKRSAYDSVRGIATLGDRALIDDLGILDPDANSGGNLTGYASSRQADLIKKGVLKADGSVNPDYVF